MCTFIAWKGYGVMQRAAPSRSRLPPGSFKHWATACGVAALGSLPSTGAVADPLPALGPYDVSVFASTTDGEGVWSNSLSDWPYDTSSDRGVTNPRTPTADPLSGPSVEASENLVPSTPGEQYETATATATATGGYHTGVTATVAASNSNPYGLKLGGANAEAQLSYEIAVVPMGQSSPSATVPLEYTQTFALEGAFTNDDGSYATADYGYTIYDQTTGVTFLSRSTADGNAELALTSQFYVDNVYVVTLDVIVYIHGNGGPVTATIDPSFTIDPTFCRR